MAEPYDTVEAIGAGPINWWRFSVASGNITNEGTNLSGTADLQPVSVGGAFNGTYRVEANPFGDGFGLLFNGQGGLDATGSLGQPRGTIFFVFRSTPSVNTSIGFLTGIFDGFDIHYCRFSVEQTNNLIRYHIQDAGTDDESWSYSVTDGLCDGAVHSLAVTPPASTTGTPAVYVDGVNVSSSLTFSGDDNVNNNHWGDSFLSNKASVGYRGGVDSSPMSGIIAYELIHYNETTPLTDDNILTLHNLLTATVPGPLTKSVRRRNFRLFAQ